MDVKSIARWLLIVFIVCLSVPALAEAHGVLRVVKGNVQIKSGETGQTSRARLGQQVFPKDTIITGKDARAKIVMIDNNEINVAPESNVEIQHYEYNPAQNKKDVLLNVLYGKIRSKVEQKYDGKTSRYQVKTPSAVAGVRGTDFITSYDSQTKSSQIVTFRGAVEFGLPGPNGSIMKAVSVTPGKMASSMAGAPPSSPVTVPKNQLAKMDHDSKADAPSGKSGERTPADSKKGNHQKSDDNGANNSMNKTINAPNASNGTSNAPEGANNNMNMNPAPNAPDTAGNTSPGASENNAAGGQGGQTAPANGGTARSIASQMGPVSAPGPAMVGGMAPQSIDLPTTGSFVPNIPTVPASTTGQFAPPPVGATPQGCTVGCGLVRPPTYSGAGNLTVHVNTQ